jgi:hypothetical protein
MGEAIDQLAAQAPAGRPATPDEIAEAIVFWRRTVRASFTAQNSPSMEDAAPFEFESPAIDRIEALSEPRTERDAVNVQISRSTPKTSTELLHPARRAKLKPSREPTRTNARFRTNVE